MFRVDHLVKNVTVIAGAFLFVAIHRSFDATKLPVLFLALALMCVLSLLSYMVNDFFDRFSDCWHPEKQSRWGLDSPGLFAKRATLLVLAASGIYICMAWRLSPLGASNGPLAVLFSGFLICSFLYNVPPVRLKRYAILDVVIESLNFPIRTAAGWYSVACVDDHLPVFAYFATAAVGGILLTGKRAAELVRIGDAAIAQKYRPSILFYSMGKSIVMVSVFGILGLFFWSHLVLSCKSLHNLIFATPLLLIAFWIYVSRMAGDVTEARELEPEKLLRSRKPVLFAMIFVVCSVGLLVLPWDLVGRMRIFGVELRAR